MGYGGFRSHKIDMDCTLTMRRYTSNAMAKDMLPMTAIESLDVAM